MLGILRRPGLGAEIARGGAGVIVVAVANRVVLLLTAILLARLLGPDGYGQYSYALAWALLLAVLAKLGSRELLIREIATYQLRGNWDRILGLLRRATQVVTAVSVLVGAALAGVVLAFADRLGADRVATLLWASILAPTLALATVRAAALKGFRRVVAGKAQEQIVGPAILLVAVAAYWLGDWPLDAPTVMSLHVAGTMVAFATGVILLRRALPPQVAVATATYEDRRWLGSALPLAVLGGARLVHRQTDIVMLGLFLAAADVGIYRTAVTGSLLVILATDAVVDQLSPYAARLHARGDTERLRRLVTSSTRAMTLTAMPLAVAFVLAGDRILSVVFGPEYATGHAALAILGVAQMLSVAAGPAPMLLNMSGHERSTARSFTISALFNVALNAVLIPVAGTIGAAVATAVSLLSWNLLLWREVRGKLGIDSSVFGLHPRTGLRGPISGR